MQVSQIAALKGHQNPIYTVVSLPNTDSFYTAGNDKGVVEWSVESMAPVRVLMPVGSSVYALHFLADNHLLAAGERNGKIRIYHFDDRSVTVVSAHTDPVFALASLNGKRELLAGSEDGYISVTDLDHYKAIYRFRVSTETVRCIAVSVDEKLIAVGCKDHLIRVYHTNDYSLVTELSGHTHPVTSLCFSPDGRFLLSGGRDARLNIWNCRGFELAQTITAHMFAIYDIKYHPKGTYFATCSQDKSIKIWSDDFRLLKMISRDKEMQAHSHSVNKIAWHGDTLISVSDDKTVMLWDIRE